MADGLDLKVLSEIMVKSSGQNWSLELYNAWPGVQEDVPASRCYSGGFGNTLMLKEKGLAAETAIAAGSPIPLGDLSRNLFALHAATHGSLDFSTILNLLRKA